MGTAILLFLVADAVFLVSLVLLVIAAFRIKVIYGFAVILLPFSGLIFAVKYWKEVGGKYLVKTASYAAMLLILGSSPELMARFGHKLPGAELVAHALGTPDAPPAHSVSGRGGSAPAPHQVHDLAETEPTTTLVPAPTVDPFAVQRAALAKHNADLLGEYQRLATERSALKPGPGAARREGFQRQGGPLSGRGASVAERTVATRRAGSSGRPANVAVLATSLSSPSHAVGDGAVEAETESRAALGRLRISVAEGNYAGFAAALRKCLADYRQTAAFPEIAAYARQVMHDTSPGQMGTALQQQARKPRKWSTTPLPGRCKPSSTRRRRPWSRPKAARKCIGTPTIPVRSSRDFNVADVVTGREAWHGDYVYMQTRPGVCYCSADCEFNPQTKFFYTNRDVPKKKLTDAENQEVVRLYRILGKDEMILNALPKRLADAKNTAADLVALNMQLAGNAKDSGTRVH